MTDAAHPITVALADLLVRMVTPRVLVLGVGNGRNLPPLLAAGARVDALDDDAERLALLERRFRDEPRLRFARTDYANALPFHERYDAALSTHALLHGTPQRLRVTLKNVGEALRVSAPLHLVLGSRADPRYRRSRRLADGAYVEAEGSEAGVPHVYFNESEVRDLLEAFRIVALDETPAAQSAGRWAHDEAEAAQIVHWFVKAEKPEA